MPKDNLSKKIRDLTRLLALDTLPETTRQEKERALASLRDQKVKSQHAHKVSTMTQKYKMVKFVEGQKAERRLSAAQKKLKQATGDDRDAVKEEVRRCKIDLEYVRYFPVLEKYISLYKDVDGSEKVKTRRDEIWHLAETGELRKGAGSNVDPSPSSVDKSKAEETPAEEVEDEKDDFFE